jgi:hypothetical protein
MDHSAEARQKRELAARARRYAAAVTQDVDRQRLLKWAGELEGEATGLEDKDRADAGGKHRTQPARRH